MYEVHRRGETRCRAFSPRHWLLPPFADRSFLSDGNLRPSPPSLSLMDHTHWKAPSAQGWPVFVRDQVSSRPRCVWAVSAVVSVLSSRYLLVELNVHFPFHLHLLQLATAGLGAAALHLWHRSASSTRPSHPSTEPGWRLLLPLATLMALSTILSLQAILHFLNLPTLLMMTVSRLASEALSRTDNVKMSSYTLEAWARLYVDRKQRSRPEIVRLVVLTLACAGTLLAEYRLLVAGLLTSVPAVLLAGAARALRTTASNTSSATTSSNRRLNVYYCGAGMAIAAACATYRADESWERFFYALQPKYVPLLVVNVVVTAVTMLLGNSLLLFMVIVESDRPNAQNDKRADVLTVLTTTGLTGLTSSLMLRRSYTSLPQLLSFLVSVAMIWIGADFDAGSFRPWWKDYEAVPNYSTLLSVDSEDTAESEESDTTSATEEPRRNSLIRLLLIAVFLLSAWIVFIALNFSGRLYQKTTKVEPVLDREYTPTTGVELVISMYKEPVDEVAYMISRLKAMPNLQDAQIHIYVKDNESDTTNIQATTGAHNVTMLPNIGREGETYLYHILNSWDTLAKHTVFLQADVHNPREFYPRVHDYFDPERTGMLSLGWSGQVCNCEECGDRFGFWDTTHLFPDVHNRINNSTQCDKVLLSYKGQFIASAKRIRGVDISVYRDLHEAFVNKDSWAHQEQYLKGRPDSMSAPLFGYTMERIWNIMFQCSSMDVAWKCPTMLSGNRIGGGVEDCQCFDPIT